MIHGQSFFTEAHEWQENDIGLEFMGTWPLRLSPTPAQHEYSSRIPCTARIGTRAQCVVPGIVSGVWGVHVPSLKQTYALYEASLSMALLAVAVGVVSFGMLETHASEGEAQKPVVWPYGLLLVLGLLILAGRIFEGVMYDWSVF